MSIQHGRLRAYVITGVRLPQKKGEGSSSPLPAIFGRRACAEVLLLSSRWVCTPAKCGAGQTPTCEIGRSGFSLLAPGGLPALHCQETDVKKAARLAHGGVSGGGMTYTASSVEEPQKGENDLILDSHKLDITPHKPLCRQGARTVRGIRYPTPSYFLVVSTVIACDGWDSSRFGNFLGTLIGSVG